jgi:hypothetical protein
MLGLYLNNPTDDFMHRVAVLVKWSGVHDLEIFVSIVVRFPFIYLFVVRNERILLRLFSNTFVKPEILKKKK